MSGKNRRGFLRSIGRASLALALGGGVGALVARNGECPSPGLCRGCASLGACELPEAMTARQAMQDERGRTDVR